MATSRQAVLRARKDRDHAACLMDIGLGVFVHEYQQAVVEHRAVAFRNGLELSDQVGELLHMPAANVA